MVLIEVNGKQHHFSESNLRWMLGTGWIFYLISLVGTFIYYKNHPSFSDIREAFIVKYQYLKDKFRVFYLQRSSSRRAKSSVSV